MKRFLNYDDFVVNESETINRKAIYGIKRTREYKDISKSFPVSCFLLIYNNNRIDMSFYIISSHVFDINYKRLLPNEIDYYGSLEIQRTPDFKNKLHFENGYKKNHTPISFDSPEVLERISHELAFTTLDEWKKSLIKIKEILKKIFDELKQKGVIVNFERPVDYRDMPFEYQKEIVFRTFIGEFEWKYARKYFSLDIFNNPEIQEFLIDKAINNELEWEDIKNYVSPELWNKYRGMRTMSQYGLFK